MNLQTLQHFLQSNGYIDIDCGHTIIPYVFYPIDNMLYSFDKRIITIETSHFRSISSLSSIKYPFIQYSLDLYDFRPVYPIPACSLFPSAITSITYITSKDDPLSLPSPFVYPRTIIEFYNYAQQQILNSPTPSEYLFHTDLFLRKVAKEVLG